MRESCTIACEVQSEWMTICGLVFGKQACKEVVVFHGALFVDLRSNGSKLRSPCIFVGWLEGALPSVLHVYDGKRKQAVHRVRPKQLVPHMICA